MAKSKLLDFSGLSIFKNKIYSLITKHTDNADIHLTDQERYRINNFPSKLSSFENDMDYITLNDFINNTECDGGGAFDDNDLYVKDIDGGNATSAAIDEE